MKRIRTGSRADIDAFVALESLAIVGVSASGRGFGNNALRELYDNGVRVFPVHRTAEAVQGIPCCDRLAMLPEPVGGVLLVTPPAQTELLVREAIDAGIRRVWMQQGAESPTAIALCADHGISCVAGHCILMFQRRGPGIHRFHRGVREFFGTLPV